MVYCAVTDSWEYPRHHFIPLRDIWEECHHSDYELTEKTGKEFAKLGTIAMISTDLPFVIAK